MLLSFKNLKLPFRPLRPEETSPEAIERVHKKLQARFARCGNRPMILRDCGLPQLAVFQCVQRHQDIYALSGEWNWNNGNSSLIIYLKDHRSHKEQLEQQHFPSFFDGFNPAGDRVADAVSLLALPWISRWTKADGFSRFELERNYCASAPRLHLLVAVFTPGDESRERWWIVARLKGDDLAAFSSLPEWHYETGSRSQGPQPE